MGCRTTRMCCCRTLAPLKGRVTCVTVMARTGARQESDRRQGPCTVHTQCQVTSNDCKSIEMAAYCSFMPDAAVPVSCNVGNARCCINHAKAADLSKVRSKS